MTTRLVDCVVIKYYAGHGEQHSQHNWVGWELESQQTAFDHNPRTISQHAARTYTGWELEVTIRQITCKFDIPFRQIIGNQWKNQ